MNAPCTRHRPRRSRRRLLAVPAAARRRRPRAPTSTARRLRRRPATSSASTARAGGWFEVDADLDGVAARLELDARRCSTTASASSRSPAPPTDEGDARRRRLPPQHAPARTRSRSRPTRVDGADSCRAPSPSLSRRSGGRARAPRRPARRPTATPHRQTATGLGGGLVARWRAPGPVEPAPLSPRRTTSTPSGKPGPPSSTVSTSPPPSRGPTRHRRRGALRGVGEDVVEQHVDERHQVRLAGVHRDSGPAGDSTPNGAALVLGQRRPEARPARRARPRASACRRPVPPARSAGPR